MNTRKLLHLYAASMLALSSWNIAMAAESPSASLAGTWNLVSADVIHADGSRGHDYGASPTGLLMIDTQGHYSLQIYSMERPHFAAADKNKGTPAEYQAAVLGASNHFGMLMVDAKLGVLTFDIGSSSYPNQENTEQKRPYQLMGDELSYRVAARPNGDVPVSVWRRAH